MLAVQGQVRNSTSAIDAGASRRWQRPISASQIRTTGDDFVCECTIDLVMDGALGSLVAKKQILCEDPQHGLKPTLCKKNSSEFTRLQSSLTYCKYTFVSKVEL